MISHGKDIKLFTGNSNPALAEEICKLIGTKLGEAEVKSFADGEASVSLYESVRGSDVFLINSTCKPVNDSLMELLIMIDACKRASAGRVTAVIPYFGYARQDRKAKSRDPISAKLVANMLTAAGADRVLTMDLHASQIQGFFDIPVDNLLGNPVFVDYYAKKFGSKAEDMVVVSPDVGSVARARTFAQKLHMNLAIVDKRRQKANQCEVMNVIGDVAGKDCILFDDMVDTAGSLCNAAKAIVEVGGANRVFACASHGVLSGPALERLEASCIEELALLNTIPESMGEGCSKIKYLSVAPMFAEAIERIYQEISIAKLFRLFFCGEAKQGNTLLHLRCSPCKKERAMARSFLLIIFLLQLLFSRFGCFPVSATAPCFVRQGRGCCWVMQWILPPPKATSRVCTPTTSRSGNISCT